MVVQKVDQRLGLMTGSVRPRREFEGRMEERGALDVCAGESARDFARSRYRPSGSPAKSWLQQPHFETDFVISRERPEPSAGRRETGIGFQGRVV